MPGPLVSGTATYDGWRLVLADGRKVRPLVNPYVCPATRKLIASYVDVSIISSDMVPSFWTA